MKSLQTDVAVEIHSRLTGLECWYASVGGKHTGSTFALAFGKKIPRARPLENSAHSDEYRNNEGEANLLVWCTWRLDAEDAIESSSDDTDDAIRAALNGIVGSRIVDVEIARPGWDLRIDFSPFHRLHVFSDHVPGEPSFDGNWELHVPEHSFYFGPGVAFEVEER